MFRWITRVKIESSNISEKIWCTYGAVTEIMEDDYRIITGEIDLIKIRDGDEKILDSDDRFRLSLEYSENSTIERLKVCTKESSVTWSSTVIHWFVTLSMISLVIVIGCHVLFPQLRNTPGKNLTAWCVTMELALISQMLTVKARKATLCTILAIFKHYIWLSMDGAQCF